MKAGAKDNSPKPHAQNPHSSGVSLRECSRLCTNKMTSKVGLPHRPLSPTWHFPLAQTRLSVSQFIFWGSHTHWSIIIWDPEPTGKELLLITSFVRCWPLLLQWWLVCSATWPGNTMPSHPHPTHAMLFHWIPQGGRHLWDGRTGEFSYITWRACFHSQNPESWVKLCCLRALAEIRGYRFGNLTP